MQHREPSIPAFGKADLTNCENEQIHLAGSIQPHGVLFMVDEVDLKISLSSKNAEQFLGLDGDPIGRTLGSLKGDLSDRIKRHLDEPLYPIPSAFRCKTGADAREFDATVHRPEPGCLVVELEQVADNFDPSHYLAKSVDKIRKTLSTPALCDDTAKIFKDVTGFDRVMVYRFDHNGHGEVISEQRNDDLEPFLGNWYPASDIPQIARKLYVLNRVRVLVDVDYEAVPLVSQDDHELNMSLCILRSMSPIHIQYLKNMGVAATIVMSLVVGGELWGLVACHNYTPRAAHYELRATCELLAETVATRLSALKGFDQAEALMSVHRLEQHIAESMSRHGDWKSALFDSNRSLLKPLNAGGAALLFDGETYTIGEVPGTRDLRSIGDWLDERRDGQVVSTASLGLDEPRFESLTPVASGLLAASVSESKGEYLMWFRPERLQTMTWGGNPFKPVEIGNDPSDLSPRRSFAKWHQLVEGTADGWSTKDLTAARLISNTVADVIIQFRSVQMLLAREQLDQVVGQVSISEQPVFIAGADESVLVANDAFKQLIGGASSVPATVRDLPNIFDDPSNVRGSIEELLKSGRKWVGDAKVRAGNGATSAVLVRADPVAVGQRLLGYVFLFTDLSESVKAEKARKRFQTQITGEHRLMKVEFDTQTDLAYRALISSIVGNAQLAALEITDDVEMARIPDLLDAIRSSTERSAQLLEHVIWHAARNRAPGDDENQNN